MSQAKHWTFTLNNPTEGDQDALRTLGSNVPYLVFGREVGANGTPHLQGYVDFGRRVRFNAAKDYIGANAHIEIKRGTPQQAADYCKKDGDFEEFGDLKKQQGKRTDWDRFTEWVVELGRIPSKREVCKEYPSLYARYKHAVFEIAKAHVEPPKLTASEPRMGWQHLVAGRAAGVPSERGIDFVVDPVGNAGKSWMCRYFVDRWPDRVQVLRVGRRDDLAFCIDESKDIFAFDIPRGQMEFFQYSILEMLKDRMVFSPKYQSEMKVLSHVPYVVVFANEQPDMNAMTSDRYNIINVE